jgi:hypothetical protein
MLYDGGAMETARYAAPRTSCSAHGIAAALCALALCFAISQAARASPRAPYPRSLLITAVRWDFAGAKRLRTADGSDIWPCTWGLDDALYCAWGDGGGFAGTDSIGRVSLGFARVSGAPRRDDPTSFRGTDLWGAPPYAEHRASFGGKVGSLIAVDGVLYAAGGLWTRQNSKDPVATWQDGTLDRLIWSADLGRSWHIAPWAPKEDLGSYLQFGRDRENAPQGYVYAYFTRPGDPTHVYLKRIAASELERAPQRRPRPQYLAYIDRSGDDVSWSPRAIDAVPVFTDPESAVGPVVAYDAALGCYLLTVGHDPTRDPRREAPGELGVFEAPHPWGPWSTVYYSDSWGRFPAWSDGDYLGLTFPVKWMSADGRTLWGVFSGPGRLDAFNVVRARLVMPRSRGAPRVRAPELLACREHYNAVNATVFASCPRGAAGRRLPATGHRSSPWGLCGCREESRMDAASRAATMRCPGQHQLWTAAPSVCTAEPRPNCAAFSRCFSSKS